MIFSCILGALLIGWAPIFVRWISLGPSMTGFYRCLGGMLLLLPLVAWEAWRRPVFWGQFKQTLQRGPYLGWTAVVGAIFALDLSAWHRSVHSLGAGLSTILGNTQVFHMAWLGMIFFGDHFNKRFLVYLGLGFLGLYLLLGSKPVAMSVDHYGEGVFYGLLTGMLYAAFMLGLRRLERIPGVQWPSFVNLFMVLLFATIFLGVLSAFNGELAVPARQQDWMALGGLALVVQVIGWILITRSLPHISVSATGLIILLQPLVAVLLAVLIFGEHFTLLQLGGACLLLFSVYRGSVLRAKEQRKSKALAT